MHFANKQHAQTSPHLTHRNSILRQWSIKHPSLPKLLTQPLTASEHSPKGNLHDVDEREGRLNERDIQMLPI